MIWTETIDKILKNIDKDILLLNNQLSSENLTIFETNFSNLRKNITNNFEVFNTLKSAELSLHNLTSSIEFKINNKNQLLINSIQIKMKKLKELLEKNYNLFDFLSSAEISISDLKTNLGLQEGKSILAYRGESKDFGKTKLLPSMYREHMKITDEINFFDLLKDYSIVESHQNSLTQKAIAAQHYIQTSRFLDITFNMLVAIYFATSQNNEDKNNKDGIFYIFCFPKYFSPSSNYIEKYYNDMINDGGKYLILKNNFKVITQSFYNERMKMQNGGFIFFPSNTITPIPSCFYKKIIIPSNLKKKIREELEAYFSIFESSLFPEKEKRKDVITSYLKKTKNNDIYSNKTIEEIEYYFSNLKLNLDFLQQKDTVNCNNKDILRTLRKEGKDLIHSVNSFYDQNINNLNEEDTKNKTDWISEKTNIINDIQVNLKTLKKRYMQTLEES